MSVGPGGEEAPSYAFGEVPVQASVRSERATPAELVAIGREIWKRVTSSGVGADDNVGNDRLLETLQEEYKDFNTSFPLVLRWMVQMRKFNAKAFEKYLLKHAAAKLDTRVAFLELQAEYLVLMYREENRHPDEAFVRRYRASLVEQLVEEDKTFLKLQAQVEEDLEARAAEVDLDRRKRLYEYLLAQKIARESIAATQGQDLGLGQDLD